MIHFIAPIVLAIASIAFVPSVVKAAQAKESKQQARRHHGLSLAEFINKVMAEGDDNDLGQNFGVRTLGLAPDHKTKAFERHEAECVDNKYRTIDIVVEKASETAKLAPVRLVLLNKKTRPGASEGDVFLLKPDGAIEKAFRHSGKMTSDGHGVAGSGINVDFDPDEAKALLKRELDFWLKGIGLKKKPAGAAAKKKPVKT